MKIHFSSIGVEVAGLHLVKACCALFTRREPAERYIRRGIVASSFLCHSKLLETPMV